MKQELFYLLMLLSFYSSCSFPGEKSRTTLELAGDNDTEIKKALSYFNGNERKQMAALFLIENMGHGYQHVAIMEKYETAILAYSGAISKNIQDSIWERVSKEHEYLSAQQEYVYDAKVISADYLIKNIEGAFEAWEDSPWFSQVGFSDFCQYILPYRTKSEPLSEWRQILRDKYMKYIEGVKNPEEAFLIIYNKVMDEFKKGRNHYPYPMTVPMINKIMKGTCDDRTLYMTCVLRALGIPAAYDYLPYWANFTLNGHSWVSYVHNDSTWAVANGAHALNNIGLIEGSRLSQKKFTYHASELSYNVDSIKRFGKVFRSVYEIQQDRIDFIQHSQEEIPDFFKNQFLKDVSAQYGLSAHKEIECESNRNVYLCNFMGAKSWQPVQSLKTTNGKILFESLNKEVVYLPAYYSNKRYVAITHPFYITKDNLLHEFIPNRSKKVTVCLKRKYVLMFHWTDRWSMFLGGKFEGSNWADFRDKDILYEINKLPIGIEKISFYPRKSYRYIRFIAAENSDPNFAEVLFLGKPLLENVEEHELRGELLHQGIESISLERGMDHNYATFFRETNTPGVPQKGYWFGYDLGKENRDLFTGVIFCPINDQNMIEPGDLYELFYFDNEWVSMGEQIATDNHLIYEKVPDGALLWLRNKTKGNEERIFTYENGKQVWW